MLKTKTVWNMAVAKSDFNMSTIEICNVCIMCGAG